jgi:hypothetical protein
MRLLLCLPTAQHVPSLLAVHQFRPDRLVLLASARGRRAAAPGRLVAALREGGLDYADRHDVVPLADEHSLPAVAQALRAVHEKHAGAEWVVNLTGGTKPTVIAAYEFFRPLGATLVYSNAAAPDVVRYVQDDRLEPWRHRPSLGEFLRGYGFRVLNKERTLCRDEEQAERLWPCALALASHAGPEGVLLLREDERHRAREGKLTVRPGQWGRVVREPGVRDLVAGSFALRPAGDGLQGKFSKGAGKFLTGGWLEAFFWNLLRRHRDALGAWDVRLGLSVSSADGVQNELDVAFMHRYTLNVIECKSGDPDEQLTAGALYKVEAIAQQFRATRVRKYLATTAEYVLAEGTEEVKPFLRTRGELYDCAILSFHQVRELARRHESAEAVAAILRL